MFHTHYELEIKSAAAPHLWIRQKHERHETLDAARTSADQIRRLARREARIIRVSTTEELVP